MLLSKVVIKYNNFYKVNFITFLMKTPKAKNSEGFLERETHLYGISGWIIQPSIYGKDKSFAFGGYFRYDIKDNLVLDGQLIDPFGDSIIDRGRMDNDFLTFEKRYSQQHNLFKYLFEKEGKIWVGTWENNGSLSIDKGEAKAVTTLIDKDCFYIACGNPRGDYKRDF